MSPESFKRKLTAIFSADVKGYSRLMSREDDAKAAAAEIPRINPRFSVEYVAKTSAYKRPADTEQVVQGLRKAGLKLGDSLCIGG